MKTTAAKKAIRARWNELGEEMHRPDITVEEWQALQRKRIELETWL